MLPSHYPGQLIITYPHHYTNISDTVMMVVEHYGRWILQILKHQCHPVKLINVAVKCLSLLQTGVIKIQP